MASVSLSPKERGRRGQRAAEEEEDEEAGLGFFVRGFVGPDFRPDDQFPSDSSEAIKT